MIKDIDIKSARKLGIKLNHYLNNLKRQLSSRACHVATNSSYHEQMFDNANYSFCPINLVTSKIQNIKMILKTLSLKGKNDNDDYNQFQKRINHIIDYLKLMQEYLDNLTYFITLILPDKLIDKYQHKHIDISNQFFLISKTPLVFRLATMRDYKNIVKIMRQNLSKYYLRNQFCKSYLVLTSHISSYQIAKKTYLTQAGIGKIRNHKTNWNHITLKTIKQLNHFYDDEHLGAKIMNDKINFNVKPVNFKNL